MANLDHIKILKSGKENWNNWRNKNPGLIPDLSETDLSNIQLCNVKLFKSENPTFENLYISAELEKGKSKDKFDIIVAQVKCDGYNFRNVNFHKTKFINSNLIGADFAESIIENCNFQNALLCQANLGKVNAENADFSNANLKDSNLAAANFRSAIFTRANIERANFQNSELSNTMFGSANLEHTILMSTKMINAFLQSANLKYSVLWEADLSYANLSWVDLRYAELRSVNFEYANLYAVKYNRWAYYRGIRIDSAYGSPRFKRFARDQDFIEEFRNSKTRYPLYLIWLIFADCGRSFGLWSGWSILIAIGFSLKYYTLGPNAFELSHLGWNLKTVLYYSVVTFTTLGFGDVVPRTNEASFWVMAEVILGYFMLGGLISILATKLARRS